MTQADASRLLREAADERDELRVRLQLMEEARVRMPVRVDVRAVGAAGADAADGDIMAIAFEVLLESTKSARDDLKAIMAHVQAMNAAKQALREQVNEVGKLGAGHQPCPPVCAFDLDAVLLVLLTAYGLDIDREANTLLDDLDSMDELGEMESMRLQMVMDRLSKMMSTLSNLMKKIADTQSQIVANLK